MDHAKRGNECAIGIMSGDKSAQRATSDANLLLLVMPMATWIVWSATPSRSVDLLNHLFLATVTY